MLYTTVLDSILLPHLSSCLSTSIATSIDRIQYDGVKSSVLVDEFRL